VFMLWAAGGSVQVFSVMSVATVATMQARAVLAVRARFRAVVDVTPELRGRLWAQVAVYLALCGVGLAAVGWKCAELGFLPTEESDWVALLPPPHVRRVVLGGLVT
jgi:ER membrane protein complex subunit 4